MFAGLQIESERICNKQNVDASQINIWTKKRNKDFEWKNAFCLYYISINIHYLQYIQKCNLVNLGVI